MNIARPDTESGAGDAMPRTGQSQETDIRARSDSQFLPPMAKRLRVT